MALALGSAGCGATGDAAEISDEAKAATDADPALRFEQSAPSLDELGRRVLNGLARQDTSMLEALRLTESEHNDTVWPELPASAPEVNFPIDYAWSNIQNRNARGLARLLPVFEERRPGFRSAECRGETEAFETFEVRTDCWIVFTVGEGPEIWEIQAFKDAIVRGGGLKVFRYYDEEPRPWRGPASR